MFTCFKEGRYQDISLMVICYASGIMGHNKRTTELAD